MSELLDLLAREPGLAAACLGVLGLLIGSFLNVVIHRMPKIMEAMHVADCASTADEWVVPQRTWRYLVTPRSACPKCGHVLRWYENIPVISWIFLKAQCSNCKTPIALRYPLVEVLGGLSGVFAVLAFGPTAKALAAFVFLLILVTLAFIDADTQLLPDDLTLPLLWLGLIVNIGGMFVPLSDAVIGAIAGYLVLWTVYWLFKLLTGKEGMGYGDFKLLAALGAWFGWQALPAVILASSVVGAVLGGLMMLLARLGRGQQFPFGPYLAGAGAVVLFYGPAINAWYLGLLAR